MKIRLIIQSIENGEKEYVHFTENFDSPQQDYILPSCTIDYDEIIEADLPTMFPLDYSLKRM